MIIQILALATTLLSGLVIKAFMEINELSREINSKAVEIDKLKLINDSLRENNLILLQNVKSTNVALEKLQHSVDAINISSSSSINSNIVYGLLGLCLVISLLGLLSTPSGIEIKSIAKSTIAHNNENLQSFIKTTIIDNNSTLFENFLGLSKTLYKKIEGELSQSTDLIITSQESQTLKTIEAVQKIKESISENNQVIIEEIVESVTSNLNSASSTIASSIVSNSSTVDLVATGIGSS